MVWTEVPMFPKLTHWLQRIIWGTHFPQSGYMYSFVIQRNSRKDQLSVLLHTQANLELYRNNCCLGCGRAMGQSTKMNLCAWRPPGGWAHQVLQAEGVALESAFLPSKHNLDCASIRWPRFCSGRLECVHGMVRAVPVFWCWRFISGSFGSGSALGPSSLWFLERCMALLAIPAFRSQIVSKWRSDLVHVPSATQLSQSKIYVFGRYSLSKSY